MRQGNPLGGQWERLDGLTRGRVQRIFCPNDANIQAQMAMAEVLRLFKLSPDLDWSDFAILARTHASLMPIRAYCELNHIAVAPIEDGLALHQVREGQMLIRLLLKPRHQLARRKSWLRWANALAAQQPDNPWLQMLQQCIEEFCLAWDIERIPASQLLDWVFEFGKEQRHAVAGKLTLSTVHGAKGREFKHVILLDGGWQPKQNESEQTLRRLYYVGMTRAEQTLTLFEFDRGVNPYSPSLQGQPCAFLAPYLAPPSPELALDVEFKELGLKDVYLDFSGRQPAENKVHQAISALNIGDELKLVGREIQTLNGMVVGKLAEKCNLPQGEVLSVKVYAILARNQKIVKAEYKHSLKVEHWETVLCTIQLKQD